MSATNASTAICNDRPTNGVACDAANVPANVELDPDDPQTFYVDMELDTTWATVEFMVGPDGSSWIQGSVWSGLDDDDPCQAQLDTFVSYTLWALNDATCTPPSPYDADDLAQLLPYTESVVAMVGVDSCDAAPDPLLQPPADCAAAAPDPALQPMLSSIQQRALQLRAQIQDPANTSLRGTRSYKGSGGFATMLFRYAMLEMPQPQSTQEYEQRLQWVAQVIVGVNELVVWFQPPEDGQDTVGGEPSGYICPNVGYADDMESMLDDCSAAQAFHATFFLWLSYFSGEPTASIGNWLHETWMAGSSIQDYWAGEVPISLGVALRAGVPITDVYSPWAFAVGTGAEEQWGVSYYLPLRFGTEISSDSPDAGEGTYYYPEFDAAAIALSKFYIDSTSVADLMAAAQAIDPDLLGADDLARVGLNQGMSNLELRNWLETTPVTFDNLDVFWWLVMGNSTARETRACEMSICDVMDVLMDEPQSFGLGLGARGDDFGCDCADGEFTCNDGQCIPGEYECDTYPDCVDMSDEDEGLCAPQECAVDEFECGDGQCIPEEYECNINADCADGSDEANCAGGDSCDGLLTACEACYVSSGVGPGWCSGNDPACDSDPACVAIFNESCMDIFECDGMHGGSCEGTPYPNLCAGFNNICTCY